MRVGGWWVGVFTLCVCVLSPGSLLWPFGIQVSTSENPLCVFFFQTRSGCVIYGFTVCDPSWCQIDRDEGSQSGGQVGMGDGRSLRWRLAVLNFTEPSLELMGSGLTPW